MLRAATLLDMRNPVKPQLVVLSLKRNEFLCPENGKRRKDQSSCCSICYSAMTQAR